MTEKSFTFEASVYHTDAESVFELRMRYRDRIVWSAEAPVDFGHQNTDDPYEPSTPLKIADLTWALNRCGWMTLSDWDNAGEEGFLMAKVAPTDFALPQVTLAPSVLAALS